MVRIVHDLGPSITRYRARRAILHAYFRRRWTKRQLKRNLFRAIQAAHQPLTSVRLWAMLTWLEDNI